MVNVPKKRMLAVPSLIWSSVAFSAGHSWSGSQDGINQGKKAEDQEDPCGKKEKPILEDPGVDGGEQDGDDDPVDGDHDVRLVVGQVAQVQVSSVAGPEHGLHPPGRPKAILLLFLLFSFSLDGFGLWAGDLPFGIVRARVPLPSGSEMEPTSAIKEPGAIVAAG